VTFIGYISPPVSAISRPLDFFVISYVPRGKTIPKRFRKTKRALSKTKGGQVVYFHHAGLAAQLPLQFPDHWLHAHAASSGL